MSAHYVSTDIGIGIIPEAESKYLKLYTAATAIKYSSNRNQKLYTAATAIKGFKLPANRRIL